MSGDPPHHPHNRPWDFIGIPNWRQPQHAHMAHKHSVIHQPNWHPPTTESMKVLGQIPRNFALHQMFDNIPLPHQPPGVDLTLTSQNGEDTTSPMSLSVKDTKKLNNAPSTTVDSPSKCSIAKIKTPECISGEAVASQSDTKVTKRTSPLDSVLERLKPSYVNSTESSQKLEVPDKSQGATIPPNMSQDESSDSSVLNIPTLREDEVTSPYNTEDSLDSNKSRRKRKPCKTQRCSSKTEEKIISEPEISTNQMNVNSEQISNPIEICLATDDIPVEKEQPNTIIIERRRRSSSLDLNIVPAKTRRKTSSESETIDNIAAMIQEGLMEKELENKEKNSTSGNDITFVPVSVIKSKDEIEEDMCQESTVSESTSTKISTLITPAQKKETHFVEIENKLEEMFAGIEDTPDPLRTEEMTLEESKMEDPLLEDSIVASTSQDNVSSTSNDISSSKTNIKSRKRKGKLNGKEENHLVELSGKKSSKKIRPGKNLKNKKKIIQKNAVTKIENIKDTSFDSNSNTSSVKAKGPFVHIKGPRSSPLSVNVVNTSSNDDDIEKKMKSKKFHDDNEYRHKVRSKGLHCSTLSTKYDAQTKDATWICVFCKKGPHTSDIPGVSIINTSYPSGDLFGPYFISISCEEYSRRLDDPYDKQFKSKKFLKALEAQRFPPLKKSKRKNSEGDGESADPYLGIIETQNSSFEVWVHEECLVWSPGVYLVGPKIIGLQEAVWTACNVVCSRCNFKGANICCLHRGCLKVTHVWCAKSLNWDFDESCFKTYCDVHRKLPETG